LTNNVEAAMQVQLQAFCRKCPSLRKAITDDLTRRSHDTLVVQEIVNLDRNPGWSKITGHGLPGAINIEWEANSNMLLVRAIAKKGNRPHALLAVFLEYLIERHGKKITSINIQLR
jgi:hypothetical protein